MANNKTALNTRSTGTNPGKTRAPERRSLEGDDQESPPDDASGVEAASKL